MLHEIVVLKQPGTCTDLFTAFVILILGTSLIQTWFLNGVALTMADKLPGRRGELRAVQGAEGGVGKEEENDAMEEEKKKENVKMEEVFAGLV